jgi:hypothetical protein
MHPRHRANFRTFDPPAFLAELCAHIPDPHEKTAIYYGWYSNRTRGFRKAQGLLVPPMPAEPATEADRAPLAIRRTRAQLIRKIYEVDPLLCSRCGATMKTIVLWERTAAGVGVVQTTMPSTVKARVAPGRANPTCTSRFSASGYWVRMKSPPPLMFRM